MRQERHRWDPVCERPAGLVRPVPVDPTGRDGPTRAQAAGPRWRRSGRRLYVPTGLEMPQPEQRILEQSMRLTGGAVTGWAAARMHRCTFFDGLRDGGRTRMPVPLNCGPLHKIRRELGDDLLRDMLYDDEIE